MAIKINNIDYSGYFYNGEALTAMYLNGNKVYGGGEHTYDPLIDSKYFVVKANAYTIFTVSYAYSPTSTIYYKKNGEDNWTTVTGNTNVILSQGDYLEMKGNVDNTYSAYVHFGTNASGNIDVGGCLMSLNQNAEITSTSQNQLTNTQTFYRLFDKCEGLVSAEHLTMASNTTQNCYEQMFQGCTALTIAPTLPATTLVNSCYGYMFDGCTSLVTAPQLPATTLANYCYVDMFHGCTALTTAPSLPATTLAGGCYQYMFQDCTALTIAPSLPATTLAESCYYGMFRGCTALTTAPTLPATTLTPNCYSSMFRDCTSLTTGPTISATNTTHYCCNSMFYNCTALTSLRVGFEQITGTRPLDSWLRNVTTNGTIYIPESADYFDDELRLPRTWSVEEVYS